jgi:hypothetical protein
MISIMCQGNKGILLCVQQVWYFKNFKQVWRIISDVVNLLVVTKQDGPPLKSMDFSNCN